MRKPPKRFFAHDAKGMIPRMSWSSHNLYNIIARTTIPMNANKINFRQVTSTMYQQRWTSKRFLRGYHGEWIGEKRFRRWFLPINVPNLEPVANTRRSGGIGGAATESQVQNQEHMPISVLFLRDVERRLDTVVYRSCFARSAREARVLVLHGKVKVNGVKQKSASTLLEPGDLISVEPSSVPMLSESMAKAAANLKEAERKRNEYAKASRNAAAEAEVAEEIKEEEEGGDKAVAETSEDDAGSKKEASSGEAQVEATSDQSKDGGETNAAEKSEDDALTASADGSEGGSPTSSSAVTAGKKKDKANHYDGEEAEEFEEHLPPGVLPFNLPPFAAPHLFVPPYLEVSFTTCSAIYMRHPTITAAPQQLRAHSRERGPQRSMYRSDIPSPYPASSEMYSLAWEYYTRHAPRVRSDVRRLRVEARVGRNGMTTARAKDQWRKVLAIRRKRDRGTALKSPANRRFDGEGRTQFVAGGRSYLARRVPVGGTAAAATKASAAMSSKRTPSSSPSSSVAA